MSEEVILYDTSDCHIDTPRGSRPGLHLEVNGEDQEVLFLQGFQTGQSTRIDSITVDIGILRGSPTGTIGIEIWDQNDAGWPGSKVAEFGAIDMAGLPSASLVPHILTTVEGAVADLAAESQYYVVFEHKRAQWNGGAVIYTTCGSAEGTNGAAKFLGRHPTVTPQGSFDVLGNVIDPSRSYLVLKVVGEAPPTHSLTITASEHGTVTADPDMPTYSAGTEITLTATPNEGYQFSKWTIGETEFTDNPLTFTIETDTTVTPEFVEKPSEVAVYSNIPDVIPPDGLPWIFPPFSNVWHAQQFITGNTGRVTSISFPLVRWRNPSGLLHIEIWNDVDGVPGTIQHTVADIDVEILVPARTNGNAEANPDEIVRLLGLDLSLTPETPYHLVFNATDVTITDGGANSRNTIVQLIQEPSTGTNGAANVHYAVKTGADWNWAPLHTVPGFDDVRYLAMEILELEGATTDPFIIATTEDGIVTAEPQLDDYPIGSEVTVTATPEPGFEFAKWRYGDQEFTTNPATITVIAGATLTPYFDSIELEPKPIDVEILPAMAIRWDSQIGQSYEVQSSPDLQSWASEAANVEGTGEQMTHFFIRDAREMYYRVLESK